MYPTFTGSSRRPRNVNLSGQRNTTALATSPWGLKASSGPSKTVADVQAERQQRKQDRDRRDAALRIQRIWRGYRARQFMRDLVREAFADIYPPGPVREDADPTSSPVEQRRKSKDRLRHGLPLLLASFATFKASSLDDRQILDSVIADLRRTEFCSISSGQISLKRLNKFANILLAVLELYIEQERQLRPPTKDSTRQESGAECQIYLTTLCVIGETNPVSISNDLSRYYKCLARFCRRADSSLREILFRMVAAPLNQTYPDSAIGDSAFEEFALSFLTQERISVFEEKVDLISPYIDILRLSEVLIKMLPGPSGAKLTQGQRLWLLAHFISLKRTHRQGLFHPLSLKALSIQLSALSTPISSVFNVEVSDKRPRIPPYVHMELGTLVDKDEISRLLQEFTSDNLRVSAMENDASILASYTLTLMQCFPGNGDDIRMRLYLADISSPSGPLPAVTYFWGAMRQTTLFTTIIANEDLRLILSGTVNRREISPNESVKREQEWQTIILFLELYIFLLRLTDDEDFFESLATTPIKSEATSRIRACGLNMDQVRCLTIFLKHLGFALYHDASHLTQINSLGGSHFRNADNLASPLAAQASSEESRKAAKANVSLEFAGIDYSSLRSKVTSALRMLYERDSRRPFLPTGHWLMTSRLDMEGFLPAVVLEDQRQQELRENDADEEDDDDDEGDEDKMAVESSSTSHFGDQRQSRYAQMEKFRLQQERAARERMMATVAPRLEVLRNLPFVIPFDTRVQIFRQFVHLDKERRRGGNIDPDRWRLWILGQHGNPFDQSSTGRGILGRHHAQIKRGQLFQDAMSQFYELGPGLKEPIQITFVDQFDSVEAGIDGGGVTKEFLTSVTKEAFTDDQSLFVANHRNAFYPNPCAIDQRSELLRQAGIPEVSEEGRESLTELLQKYEFLGRIVGKCMYEGILIDIAFAGFFLLKWSSSGADAPYRANINDLREMDDELYQGMLRLKNYPGDVSELALDFTINDQVSLPDDPVRTITRELIRGRGDMAVNNENRPLYISYVARHRLLAQPSRQTNAFLRGLGTIIDPSWLSMFNQSELQRLVGGDSSEIDIEDLRSNTAYSGVYAIGDDGEEHPTVRLFWEVMRDFDDTSRRDVLKYVTSTPRAPLLGFGQLSPPFSIRDGGSDQERLPSASTCVNLLKLPQYTTAEALKRKLLYAVKSGAGFDLS